MLTEADISKGIGSIEDYPNLVFSNWDVYHLL